MSPLLQLLLTLSIVVVAAKLAGAVSRRCGLPSVFGELLAGVILGPTAVNLLGAFPLSGQLSRSLADLSELGVVLLMFLAGVDTDLTAMKRVGWAALAAAVGGVILPLAAGIGVSVLLGLPPYVAIFLGTVLTATSVSITAETLMELGQIRSREGVTILGAAVIDDVIGVVLVSVVLVLVGGEAARTEAGPMVQVGLIIARMGAYLAGAALAGKIVRPLLRWASEQPGSEEGLIALTLGAIFLFAWGAEYFGSLAPITGAYLLGVLIARTPIAERIGPGVRAVAYSLLVPVFFVHVGMQVDVRQLAGTSPGATLLIVVVAIATKIAGAGLGAMTARFQPLSALRVGVGMVSRGEVALVIASAGLQAGILNRSGFVIAVTTTVVTTLVTPLLLRLVFRRASAADGAKPRHRPLKAGLEVG